MERYTFHQFDGSTYVVIDQFSHRKSVFVQTMMISKMQEKEPRRS
jgi:hypothetical protein